MIDRIKALHGRSRKAPELVYLASALWDTARWMREDVAAQKDAESFLSA